MGDTDINGDELYEHILKASKMRRDNPIPTFEQFIESYFCDHSLDATLGLYYRELKQNPWTAEDIIICLDYILSNPPDSLKWIIEERGWICFQNLDGSEASNADYLGWIKILNSYLTALYQDPPHSDEELDAINESYLLRIQSQFVRV